MDVFIALSILLPHIRVTLKRSHWVYGRSSDLAQNSRFLRNLIKNWNQWHHKASPRFMCLPGQEQNQSWSNANHGQGFSLFVVKNAVKVAATVIGIQMQFIFYEATGIVSSFWDDPWA